MAVAAFVVYVVSQNRGVAPYSWPNIATFLVVGISLGGIYAISALGLVVTYATTGIFNFAHGAIGCFLAFVYWELRVNRNWPAPLALFVVVFVMAPLLGVALDKLLMRRLRNVALVVQLMVTVGLMLAFMGLTLTIWKPDTGRSLNHFFESSSGVHVGQVVATWSRIITVVVALVIAVQPAGRALPDPPGHRHARRRRQPAPRRAQRGPARRGQRSVLGPRNA